MAAANPAKVREMTDLMFAEFAKYQVLPLDASVATRMVTPRPSMSAGRKVFTYSGKPITGIPRGTAPSLLNTSYTITADIEVPQGGADGMIVTDGGRFGGYGMYLLNGKPVFLWNLLDLKRVRWESADALAPGKHTIEYDFTYDGLGFATLAFNNISGIGRPGTGTFKVDGKVVSTQTIGAYRSTDTAMGRDLRHRVGHRHAGERPRLPSAVQVHWQDRQADNLSRAPETHACGCRETSKRSFQCGRRQIGGEVRIKQRHTITQGRYRPWSGHQAASHSGTANSHYLPRG